MRSSKSTLASRLFVVLGGLLLTYVVGLAYLNARFDSGLAPAPFLTTMFLFGMATGFVCASLLPPSIAYRLVLLVAAVAVIGIAASSNPVLLLVRRDSELRRTLRNAPASEGRRVVGAWRAMPLPLRRRTTCRPRLRLMLRCEPTCASASCDIA